MQNRCQGKILPAEKINEIIANCCLTINNWYETR